MKIQAEEGRLIQEDQPTRTSEEPPQFATDPYQLRITF